MQTTIAQIINFLETFAPPSYQESYDNSGLVTGDASQECTGVLICLDATEAVLREAVGKGCNLVISHHPVIFRPIRKIEKTNEVGSALIIAIKNDIAIYSIHTNLDNVIEGVNGRIADTLELLNCSVLAPRPGTLKKLFTFVPDSYAEAVRKAIFDAGGGQIGKYSECSFNSEGSGTFKAGEGTSPFLGRHGERHVEHEVKMEVIFFGFLEHKIIEALKSAHPYEEVAYDMVELANIHSGIGAGIVGELKEPMEEDDFLRMVKQRFKLKMIRHTAFLSKPVFRVAICGGAGSSLINNALACKADIYITSDIKYHEFFEGNGRMLIADIGHFESEQFTIDLIYDILQHKFNTFALLKTEVETNPVNYFLS